MKYFSDEKGQMIALFAMGFALFCGILGFSIDAGNMYWQRTKLQAGLDAACLAGASSLPDSTATAKTKLRLYATENGISAGELLDSDIETPTNWKIRAKATRPVRLFLMPVLGFDKVSNVSVSAAAAPMVDYCFSYAVFSGSPSQTLILGGSLNVDGSTWGNYECTLNGNPTISGDVYSVGETSKTSSNIGGTIQENLGTVLPMPTDGLSNKVLELAQEAELADGVGTHIFTGPKTFANGSTINCPVYVNGDVTIDGTYNATGTILATGKITIGNVYNTADTTNDPHLCLCAMGTGGINKLNGNRVIHSILYAPTASFYGNGDAVIYGNVVIRDGGQLNGNLTVNGTKDTSSIPYYAVHLVSY